MPRIYNHRHKVRRRVPLKKKQILPGSIIEFRYAVPTARDRRPILLVLANGMWDKAVNSEKNILVHGINFNYLNNHSLRRLFTIVAERPIRGRDFDMVDKERDALGRYIPANQRYTRLNLPLTEAKPNVSQIRPYIQSIYGNTASQILNKADAYRKYIVKEIGGVRGLQFDIPDQSGPGGV